MHGVADLSSGQGLFQGRNNGFILQRFALRIFNFNLEFFLGTECAAGFRWGSSQIRAVVQAVIDRHLDAVEAIAAQGGNLREQLLAIGAQMIRSALDPDLVAIERVVTGEAQRFPELATLLGDAGATRLPSLLADLLQQARGAGTDEEQACLDAEIFLRGTDLFRGFRAGGPYATRPGVAVARRDHHQRMAARARARSTDRGTLDQRSQLVAAGPETPATGFNGFRSDTSRRG